MHVRWLLLISLALVVCCGSSTPGDTEKPHGNDGGEGRVDDPPADPETVRRQENLRKLREAQEGGCLPMCERITECAVADARKNMSPEELAKLDLEKTAPQNTEQCTDSCNGSELSLRQVKVMYECLNLQGECPKYLACLDRIAKP